MGENEKKMQAVCMCAPKGGGEVHFDRHDPGAAVELVLHPLRDDPTAGGAGVSFGGCKCLGTCVRTLARICNRCGVVYVEDRK
jgi:hypothetical protein